MDGLLSFFVPFVAASSVAYVVTRQTLKRRRRQRLLRRLYE